jgi:heavy metal sensor kinase
VRSFEDGVRAEGDAMMRMSLTTRLTAFFLGALALLLAGFTATLFLLARSHLQRQVGERLEGALHTLVAAIEFNPEGLEWEPNQRLVTLGQGPEAEQVRWLVRDDVGASVARSRNLDPSAAQVLGRLPMGETRPQRPLRVPIAARPWQVVQRRVAAPTSVAPDGPLPPKHYRALILTAALDVQPIEATLGTLVRTSSGLSAALWLLAAMLGSRFCRRALRPVTRMAEAARGMHPAGREQRLPVPRTRDELQDLGDAFNDLLARLQEAFERQRRFTGDASHQLRTPLAAMLGQVEVALRRERSGDDYRRVLGLVRDQAAHLGQMVQMLLFLARADAEAELPDLEALDLADWLSAQRPRWADHPRAADLHIDIGDDDSDDDGPHPVRVHPPLLGQLLDNLIDNAIKYSAPGTPIHVRVGRESGRVALSVEDLGVGIDAEDLPHIFEPFYRSPRARRDGRSGVGLGLSVAQRIAATFHGAIVARSEPGRGSRFVLLLPAVPEPLPVATAETVA